MKTKLMLTALALGLSTINSQLSTCFAQGALTPPGAPAPTMKSLDQVEARTPISSAPFTISQPGSYYLTANVSVSSENAINIATNGVTLDLNGFTISSTASPAGGTGIKLAGSREVTIANGHIKGGVTNNGSYVYGGPGFHAGIDYSGVVPLNIRVANLSVSGCSGSGIALGGNTTTTVEACNVKTVGGTGIAAASVKGCSVTDCNSGISAAVASDCVVNNSVNIGMNCGRVLNCSSSSKNSYGIFAGSVENSFGGSDTGTGLYADTALNSKGASNTGIGLQADTASLCQGYRPSGTAIKATIAIGCSADLGTNLITYKYNMP